MNMLAYATAMLLLTLGAARADNGEDLGWAFSPAVPPGASQPPAPASGTNAKPNATTSVGVVDSSNAGSVKPAGTLASSQSRR